MAISGELRALGPTVIGATGGSGTRAVAQIVRGGGVFLGERLNESDDALDFAAFSERWLASLLASGTEAGPTSFDAAMVDDFEASVTRHLAPIEGSPRRWGWKEPRSMFLLPFCDAQFPTMRFVHVVRDGRDMAFSTNQNQLRKLGRALLDPDAESWPGSLRSIAVWQRANSAAADYGEARMDERYLRLRFEDLCDDPEAVIERILVALGLPGTPRDLATHIKRPSTIGRWRWEDAGVIAQLQQVAGPTLARFGYEIVTPPAAPAISESSSVERAQARTVVCLAGMHRSGSSMVANVLRLLGLHLGPPEDLMPATGDNPDGYWENVRFQRLNDDLLGLLGGGWDYPPPLPATWDDRRFAPLVQRARAIAATFGTDPWGWKDPRNSLIVPFWQHVIPHLKVIVIVRNPLDIAASLRRRNGSSLAAGLALWYAYYRRILDTTSPEDRIITVYDAYFQNLAPELRRLMGFLGLPLAEPNIHGCREAIADELRHSRSPAALLPEAGVAPEIVRLYHDLCAEAGWNDRAVAFPPSEVSRPLGSSAIPAADDTSDAWIVVGPHGGAGTEPFVTAQDGIIHRQHRQIVDLTERLMTIEVSPILRGAMKLRRVRHRLVPPGSYVERVGGRAAERLRKGFPIRGLGGGPPALRIVIAGPPKAGNMWLKCLLGTAYGLRQLNDTNMPKGATFAEFEQMVSRGHFPEGAIFHRHLRYSPELCDLAESIGCQIVTIIRDPYDLFVSLYYYRQEVDPSRGDRTNVLRDKPIDHAEVLDFLRNQLGGILDMANAWVSSGRSLVVRYEDLHHDPVAEMTRLTHQISPIGQDAIARAVSACQADQMRKQSSVMATHIRSATVGDWRNHLGPEHLDVFRERYAAQIRALGYEVR